MHVPTSFKHGISMLCVAAGALAPTFATAQSNTTGDQWQVSASIYGYLPTTSGTTRFPSGGGTSVSVDAKTILDHLKMTFMGTLDVHNGRWGVINDVLYLNLGNTKSGTMLSESIPVGISATLGYDLKGTVWTVAGQYRMATNNPAYTMDLLAGARYFGVKPTLNFAIGGVVGSHPLAGRSGTVEFSENVWDGIIGVKGRYAFGSNRQWYVPYYLDVGTGQSDLTWQAATGVGYVYSWGEVSALWRHLDYNMKSDRNVQSMTFNGPMLGATFRW